jgi:hypothetical protein
MKTPQKNETEANGASELVLAWDVSARGLRLKFRGAGGLTVLRRSPRLAETVGRFILREIGLDPDNLNNGN